MKKILVLVAAFVLMLCASSVTVFANGDFAKGAAAAVP
jgi:hypothetical protein